MRTAVCSTTTTPAAPSLTEAAFCAWLGTAAAGDAVTYHRGALARDTCASLEILPLDERVRVTRLASRALRLSEAGYLHLVQRRHGFEDYEYVAVARRRPRRTAPALRPRVVAEAA